MWPLLLSLWASLQTSGAIAQQPVRIGPALGYDFGVPLMADRTAGNVNRFGASGAGTSYNHTATFGAQLTLPGLIASWIDPTIRLSIGAASGRFTSDPFRAGTIFNPTIDTLEIPIVESFELYSTLNVAQIDLPFEFHMPGEWRIGVGPRIIYRLSSGFIETLSIESPDTNLLPGISRRWVADGGEELAAARLRGGALLEVSLPIALNDRVTLQPELHSRLDAGALGDGFGVRAFTLGAGVSLLFDPSSGAPASAPDAGIGSLRDTAASALHASIDIYSDDTVALIRMERTRHRHAMPLLPVIFFEPRSSDIPERYARITPEEAAGFTRNALAQLEPDALYHQTLNVLGMRMRGDPASTLALHGSSVSDEPSSLARQRAERLRSYLTDIWGIASSRITVDVAPRGRPGALSDDARAVTMTSASAALLEPIVTEWIVRAWSAPQVGVRRSITGADVRRWSVTVRRGADLLARYSSADEGGGENLGGAFQMPPGDADPEPFVAELTAIDAAGHMAVARDTLRVLRAEADPNAPIRREVLVYSFLDDDRSDDMLRSLSGAIRDDARIDIVDLPGARSAHSDAAHVGGKLLEALGPTRHLGDVKIGRAADSGITGTTYPEAPLLNSGARVSVEQGR
jgi:hypothetical protein